MKVIFITGYWKSGTTLLQFLLAKDKNIQNVFPRGNINYDGTEFWREYLPSHTTHNGHYIPARMIRGIKVSDIKSELHELHDGSEYILLKRPQFVLNANFIKIMYPDVSIIATKRDLLPNIYSMLRMRKLNNYHDSAIVGLYMPRWKQMKSMSPIESLVYQYCYANNYIEKNNIFTVDYADLCDDTQETLYQVGREIDHNIDIDIPGITNCDIDYIEGTTINSRNDDTAKGNLVIEQKEKTFLPLTENEINLIHVAYDKYKDIEVI